MHDTSPLLRAKADDEPSVFEPAKLLRKGCLGLAVLAIVVVGLAGCGGDDQSERQVEVAERSATVMPFDLDATTHTFTHTDDGGIQTVTHCGRPLRC